MSPVNADALTGELEQSFWVTSCLVNTGCNRRVNGQECISGFSDEYFFQ